MNEVNPTISKVFHDIRNSYQSLYAYLDTPAGEEPVISKERIMDYLHRDLMLMAQAEATCKACMKGD